MTDYFSHSTNTDAPKYLSNVGNKTRTASPGIWFDGMGLPTLPFFSLEKLSLRPLEEPVGVAGAITQAWGVSVRVLLSRAACRHMHLNNEQGSIRVFVLLVHIPLMMAQEQEARFTTMLQPAVEAHYSLTGAKFSSSRITGDIEEDNRRGQREFTRI